MNGNSVVGVAWAANLVSSWTSNDLLVNSGSAVNSIRSAGLAGSKVINIAWGTGIAYSAVAEEIEFWYHLQDVVFVGAAGTWKPCRIVSADNTLFPAELTDQPSYQAS